MEEPTTDRVLSLIPDPFLPFQQVKRQHRLPIGERRRENIAVLYDLLDHGLYFKQEGVGKAKYDKLMEPHRLKAYRRPRNGVYYNEIRARIDRQPSFLTQSLE